MTDADTDTSDTTVTSNTRFCKQIGVKFLPKEH